MQKLVDKLRHAFIGILVGKYLFEPINKFMAMEPCFVVWKRCPGARTAFKDWAKLTKETAPQPKHVKELVSGPVN